jgi:hypothetical protein
MNTTDTADGPTPAETLTGGMHLAIGPEGGIFVRQIPLREMDALLAAQGDETKLALLYTGKPLEWFERLDLTAQEAIVTEGDRINADFFGRWFRRRLDRQERLMPGSRAKLLNLLDTPNALGPSPSLPPQRVLPAE